MHTSIRPLVESDAYTSVKWRNIPEIWNMTEYQPDRTVTLDDELAWIRKVLVDDSSRRFAIIVDAVYIGNIYLTGISNDMAEYHIFIGETAYWGKGIAKKASEILLSYAKNTLGLAKVFLRVHEKNEAAIALYKKLGFQKRSVNSNFVKMEISLRGY